MIPNSLKIGQIIYVLTNRQSIVPAMVVEETCVQTLKGKNVSWKLALGIGDKQKIVELKEVKGELFESLDEIEAFLTKKFSDFIKEMISLASRRESAWYGKSKLNSQPKNLSKEPSIHPPVLDEKFDPESLIDDFEEDNGNFPQKVQQPFNSSPIPTTKQSIREQLRNISTPTEEEMREKNDSHNTAENRVPIQLPNGTKVSVEME